MDAIHQAGVSYLVRARANHDPRVIKAHALGRGYRRGEGLHLKDAFIGRILSSERGIAIFRIAE